MIALWILVGFQFMQTAAIVVLLYLQYLRNKERKQIDIENSIMTVNIVELVVKTGHRDDRFPWFLYEPGSVNHPASSTQVDQYQSAWAAVTAAQTKYPNVPIVVIDAYLESIDPKAILIGTAVEAS